MADLFTGPFLFQVEQLIRMELACSRHVAVVGQDQSNLAALITLSTKTDPATTANGGQELTDEAKRWFKHAR